MSERTGQSTGPSPLRVNLVALVALLAVLPLTSVGATNGIRALWLAGLVVLLGGSVVTLLVEFGLDSDH